MSPARWLVGLILGDHTDFMINLQNHRQCPAGGFYLFGGGTGAAVAKIAMAKVRQVALKLADSKTSAGSRRPPCFAAPSWNFPALRPAE